MKIADAVVEVLEKKKYSNFIDNEVDVVIPKLDHEFCHFVLMYAGKNPSKGKGWYNRELECNRVARALEKDLRFEKFTHITGRNAYKYIGGIKWMN